MNFFNSSSVLSIINQSSFSTNYGQNLKEQNFNSKKAEVSKSVNDSKQDINKNKSEYKKLESNTDPNSELNKNMNQVDFNNTDSKSNIQDPPTANIESNKSNNLDPVMSNVGTNPGKIRNENETQEDRSFLKSKTSSSFSKLNQTQYQNQESKDVGRSPDSNKAEDLPKTDQNPNKSFSPKIPKKSLNVITAPKFNIPKFKTPKF